MEHTTAATAATKIKAIADFWQDRFAPAAQHNAGAGFTMYRKCLCCGGQAMEGALSAHARWCDQQQAQKAILRAAAMELA